MNVHQPFVPSSKSPQGEKPFASCASVSYILCLVAGYLIKYSTMEVCT